MEPIAVITDGILGLEKDEAKVKTVRHAVRVVLFDKNNKIAIIYSDKHGHYKLPGGGIEGNEDFESTAKREVLEEIGCEIDFQSEPCWVIEEIRNEFEQKQISYVFLGNVAGNIGKRSLTTREIEAGFHEPKWVGIGEAIALLEKDKPKTYIGKSMHMRDLTLLRTIKKYLDGF